MHVRNPVEWSVEQVRLAGTTFGQLAHTHERTAIAQARPVIRRITLASIADALSEGVSDFAAFRTDVAFICAIYPLAGLVLARLISDTGCCHCYSRWRPASPSSDRSQQSGCTK
jgi:uncharacterized membrane protein